jgi:hypothetical protein
MDDSEHRDGRRRSHKGWWIALSILVVLVIAGSLYLVLSRSSVEKRLAAVREAGYPTNFVELAEYNKLPEGVENAASVYEEAFYSFVPLAKDANVPLLGGVALPDRGEPLPEAMAETISKYLAENQKCLGLLREAGAIEHCRYTWDYTTANLPHLAELREYAQLLELAAVFHAHKGQAGAVAALIEDGLRLSDSQEGEPLLISHMVRVACITLPIRGLERALSVTSFTDAQLRDLRDAMARTAGSIDLAEVLVMERCYMIECFTNPAVQSGLGGGRSLLDIPIVGKTGLIDYLDYMADCIEASKLGGTERVARLREIQEDIKDLSFFHVLIKVVAPALSRVGELDLKIQGHMDLGLTAIAIERYRLAKGRLPQRLEELVPEYLEAVPIDPFDDRPIRYKRTEPGYVIYIVGEDGKDNGGTERDRDKRDQPYDLPFIVTR